MSLMRSLRFFRRLIAQVVVAVRVFGQLGDGRVEVAVFDAQFDQLRGDSWPDRGVATFSKLSAASGRATGVKCRFEFP